MKLPRWLKSDRVTGPVIIAALLGFICAALIFGKPWHLPPNWGDIPTWLAVVVATFGGRVALRQFNQQAQIYRQEVERNVARDDLLERQRRDLQYAERARQRAQADEVDFTTHLPSVITILSDPTFQPAPRCILVVENKSKRPIRNIQCGVSAGDGFKAAVGVGYMSISSETDQRERPRLYDPWTMESTLPIIRAGERYGFLVDVEIAQDTTLPTQLARFDDDDKTHWQLDEYMHLTKLEARDW